jgi:hypothetical protein
VWCFFARIIIMLIFYGSLYRLFGYINSYISTSSITVKLVSMDFFRLCSSGSARHRRSICLEKVCFDMAQQPYRFCAYDSLMPNCNPSLTKVI